MAALRLTSWLDGGAGTPPVPAEGGNCARHEPVAAQHWERHGRPASLVWPPRRATDTGASGAVHMAPVTTQAAKS
jgi:hypothetical protein